MLKHLVRFFGIGLIQHVLTNADREGFYTNSTQTNTSLGVTPCCVPKAWGAALLTVRVLWTLLSARTLQLIYMWQSGCLIEFGEMLELFGCTLNTQVKVLYYTCTYCTWTHETHLLEMQLRTWYYCIKLVSWHMGGSHRYLFKQIFVNGTLRSSFTFISKSKEFVSSLGIAACCVLLTAKNL